VGGILSKKGLRHDAHREDHRHQQDDPQAFAFLFGGGHNNPITLPSGKLTFYYGKSPFLMGKLTISMAIFNSFL